MSQIFILTAAVFSMEAIFGTEYRNLSNYWRRILLIQAEQLASCGITS